MNPRGSHAALIAGGPRPARAPVSTRSLISGEIPGTGASSLFLSATFAATPSLIRFLTKTNTISGHGALVFLASRGQGSEK